MLGDFIIVIGFGALVVLSIGVLIGIAFGDMWHSSPKTVFIAVGDDKCECEEYAAFWNEKKADRWCSEYLKEDEGWVASHAYVVKLEVE